MYNLLRDEIVKLRPAEDGDFFLSGFDDHANDVILAIHYGLRDGDYLFQLLKESDIEVNYIFSGDSVRSETESKIREYLKLNDIEDKYNIFKKDKFSIIVAYKVDPDLSKIELNNSIYSFHGVNPHKIEEKTIYCETETICISNLLKDCGLTKSTSESMRLIKQNGVTIGCVLAKLDTFVLADNVYRLYLAGKRNFMKVRVSQSKGNA